MRKKRNNKAQANEDDKYTTPVEKWVKNKIKQLSEKISYACKNVHQKLTEAIVAQDILSVEKHIQHANVNYVPQNDYRFLTGDSLLHYLALTKPEQITDNDSFKYIAQLLMDYRANPNKTNRIGQTPLHNACMSQNKLMVYLLTKHHANLNHQDDNGSTPLHIAVRKGNREIIDFLIRCGVNTDLKDRHGKTAADYAKTVELLSFIDKCQQQQLRKKAKQQTTDTLVSSSNTQGQTNEICSPQTTRMILRNQYPSSRRYLEVDDPVYATSLNIICDQEILTVRTNPEKITGMSYIASQRRVPTPALTPVHIIGD